MTIPTRATLAFFFLCSALSPALAGENAWEKIAFDAVHVVFLTGDPARPSTLYAATSLGLKKSMDGGVAWSDLGQNLPGDTPPNSVAVNYLNSKELYIGYEGKGIFKSADGGATWQAVNAGLPNSYVRCIAISPKDPNLLYAGIQGGVAVSFNGGKQWQMSSGFRPTVNVNCIAVNPKDPQVLYAGTGGGGVFRSGNGGVSWKDVNQGLSSLSILALHIDPDNPNIMLAGAYHPATPTDFYVGEASGGAFRTVDGGENWAGTALLNLTIFSFASDGQYPGTVYAGAWGGAYRSTDAGEKWADIHAGLDNPFLHSLRVLPVRPPVILAGTTFGLLSYTDRNLETLLRERDEHFPYAWPYTMPGVAVLLAASLFLVRRGKKRAATDPRRPVW
jgi:photosystem II stability/assembly factor-like uncharacterized protein